MSRVGRPLPSMSSLGWEASGGTQTRGANQQTPLCHYVTWMPTKNLEPSPVTTQLHWKSLGHDMHPATNNCWKVLILRSPSARFSSPAQAELLKGCCG